MNREQWKKAKLWHHYKTYCVRHVLSLILHAWTLNIIFDRSSKYNEKQRVLIKLVPNHKVQVVQYKLLPLHCITWLEEDTQHQVNYSRLSAGLYDYAGSLRDPTVC